MKASEVPIGTRVKQKGNRDPFEYATVIANNTRQGDEVLVVETEGDRCLFIGVNVNDVEVFLTASCEQVRKRIIDGCEDHFSGATFLVYDRAERIEYVDPNTSKRYSVKIEVECAEWSKYR